MEIVLAIDPIFDRSEVDFEPQLKPSQYFDCRITLHCRYQKICEEILECLNEAEMDDLTESTQFGDLIKCGKDFNVSAQIVWYMMIRQSKLTHSDEFWMVVNERPLRFSKMEFALLTGLQFSREMPEFPHSDEFKKTHFKGNASVKTTDILKRMHLLKKKKRNPGSASKPIVRLAALYFATGVLCPSWHLSDPIDNNILRLASDWERFRSFQWANMSFDILLRNLSTDLTEKQKKIASGEAYSRSHSIGGFVHPLQVLAYECIPGIARKYVDRKVGDGLPLARMCRWSSGRWNPKKCPTFNAITDAANESEDVISRLTPTEEECAATYIRDGAVAFVSQHTVTQHISQLLSRGVKVFCTPSRPATSSYPSPPNPSPPHPSPPHRSTSGQSPPPSTSHQSPSPPPSPPHPSTSRHQSPPPPPPPPPFTSTSTSIDLSELCKFIDSKFEYMDTKFNSMDARLVEMSSEISILGGKLQTVCDHVMKAKESTTELRKRPLKTREEVVKRRRKYVETYEDVGAVESSHVDEPTTAVIASPLVTTFEGAESSHVDEPTTALIASPLATTFEAMPSSPIQFELAVSLPPMPQPISPESMPSVPLKRVAQASKFLVTPFTAPGTDTSPPPRMKVKGKEVASSPHVPDTRFDLFGKRNVLNVGAMICLSTVEARKCGLGSYEMKWFNDLMISPRWLDTDHIRESLHGLQTLQNRYPDIFAQDVAIADTYFVISAIAEYKSMLKDKKDDMSQHGLDCLISYVLGEAKSWKGLSWREKSSVWMPLNVKGMHWVAVKVDLIKKRFFVYDCNKYLCKKTRMDSELRPLLVLIPKLLDIAGIIKGKGKVKAWPYTKAEQYEEDETGGDCGVYAIKSIEIGLAKGDQKLITNEHMNNYRLWLAKCIWSEEWVLK